MPKCLEFCSAFQRSIRTHCGIHWKVSGVFQRPSVYEENTERSERYCLLVIFAPLR